MSKQSTYQKLRAENLLLKQELIMIATKPESSLTKVVLMKWKMNADIEAVAWQGDSINKGACHFAGLMPKIGLEVIGANHP